MAEKTPIFALKNVHLSFGTHSLFQGLNIYVGKGDKICLIGRSSRRQFHRSAQHT